MKLFHFHPITRRRLRRFRRIRYAYYSFLALTAIYALSLAAELLCNDRPLLVRCAGRWYVPFVRFYPEDTFLHNDRYTRPNYKELARRPIFSERPENWMLFAPIPYGPREILTPGDIGVPDRVTVRFRPRMRVASVYVGPTGDIVRERALEDVTGEGGDWTGQPLDRLLRVPEALERGIRLRFANDAANEMFAVSAIDGRRVSVYLTAFEPRAAPPRYVRLRIEEDREQLPQPETLIFPAGANEPAESGALWAWLDEDQRTKVREGAARRSERIIASEELALDGRVYDVHFEKEDIRFPFRPVRGHPMGIDSAGRDVLARMIYGLRVSMTFGLILVVFTMLIGIVIGAIQGYFAGWTDIVGQRLIEVWQSLPFLYILILLGAVYGRGFGLLLVTYGLFNWIGISYYMRAEFLRLRSWPFVEAARCMGLPARKIMARHILPNAMTPIITFFPFSLVGAIGILAALDYLGFGMPAPTASWGELLAQAQEFIWAWWLIAYPATGLFIVILLTVFTGEGVRAAFDPKQFVEWE